MTLSVRAAIFVSVTVASLVLGGTIAVLAVRAARRTSENARSLRVLAAGVGLIALGPLAGAVLHGPVENAGFDGAVVQSLLTTVGFGALVYSLRMRTTSPGRNAA